MSDDDLIRRGDALAIVVRDRVPTNRTGSEFRVVSTQDMLKAIAALPAVTVGVKPLVWEAGERDQRRADSILGEFCVMFFGGRWFYQGEPRKGMLDAQAAAQADYEARILAALGVTPTPLRYMGQIMAECDCQREAECQAAGRRIAEERR